MTKMKLCVYFGTFNPVHIAHLIIAQVIKDQAGVDKVRFIPAHIPPHRENGLAPAQHRLKMLELATFDNPDFEVSDIEFRREGKSYTYLTIKQMLEENPEITGKINFIIGSDAFAKIDSWYEAEKLAELVKFIIIPREEKFDEDKFLQPIELKNFEYKIGKVPLMDISSTFIRDRITCEKSIQYLVAEKVRKYIHEHNLF